MKNNNLFLEKIIKRALNEEPTGEPTGAPPSGPTGAPPTTEELKYYTYENKQNAGPFTAEELKNKKWNDNSYVWPEKDGTQWVQVKTIPELSAALKDGATIPAEKSPNTTEQSTDTGEVLTDAEKDSFMSGCVDAASARNSLIKANEKFLKQDLEMAADREEANQIYEKHLTDQGEQDKKVFFKACLGEWKTKFPRDARIQKFDTAVNNWMKSTGKDLMNKAFSAGGNILLKIANNALKSKGISLTEDIIKKNTKNHLIEIYNRKNRRRY